MACVQNGPLACNWRPLWGSCRHPRAKPVVRLPKGGAMVGRRRRSREEGQDLVEWAIVLPLLLLFILGIIEGAIIVFSYDTIANAAREGARTGIVPGATAQEVCDAVVARALALDLTYNAGDPTCPAVDPYNVCALVPGSGGIVRVEVDYEVHLLIGPIIDAMGGNPTLPLHAVASMIAE